MVAMPLYTTNPRLAPGLGRWPLTSLSHRLAISVADPELGNALRTALVLRPEFIAANDNSADVVVTDSHDFHQLERRPGAGSRLQARSRATAKR